MTQASSSMQDNLPSNPSTENGHIKSGLYTVNGEIVPGDTLQPKLVTFTALTDSVTAGCVNPGCEHGEEQSCVPKDVNPTEISGLDKNDVITSPKMHHSIDTAGIAQSGKLG